MHVLVTGATGRIGRHLTAELLTRGDRVRALVLPNDPGLGPARERGIECISGTLSDTAALAEAIDDIDGVVHLAAAMLWGDDTQNGNLFEENVRGTFNLFAAAPATTRSCSALSSPAVTKCIHRYWPTALRSTKRFQRRRGARTD